MTLTRAIAIYGAVVSSAGLGWQVHTWRHAQKNKVRLEVSAGMLARGPQLLEAIIITLVNNNDHSVTARSVGLQVPAGQKQTHAFFNSAGADTLPGEVKAHDSGSARILWNQLGGSGIDVYGPIAATVWLTTGEIISSDPRILFSR